MIAEYALEPEMVAAWCTDHYKCLFYKNQFGSAQGRLASRFPKKWASKIWNSFAGGSEMERKRLEELMVRLQETMVKRKDFIWDENASWVDNAVQEHARHPFRAILARNNPSNRPEILCEDRLYHSPCPRWDSPHGKIVRREATEMAEVVKSMLTCCRWVKFIDPYISPNRPNYRPSLKAFLTILVNERSVGPVDYIEIHTGLHGATNDFLRRNYIDIIPNGLKVVVYQWQTIPNEQELHNRYILTDLGGVSFLHGLDSGGGSNTFDDVNRLAIDQYELRCKQYDKTTTAFDAAAAPLVVNGK